MQTTIEKVVQGRKHTFTPEFIETTDGKFYYLLRHHIEGQPDRVDELYQVGTFETKQAGHGASISHAYRYIAEHEFGL